MKNTTFNKLFEEYFCNIGILDALASAIEQSEKKDPKPVEEEKKEEEAKKEDPPVT